MKKALSLLLALVMCLSLCACGGGSTNNTNTENSTPDTNDSNTTPVVNSVGDSVSTDLFNCKLTSAEFGNELCNHLGESYILPCTEHYHQKNPYVAESGYEFLSFTFELTYLGTTEHNVTLGSPESMDFLVKYDDAYEFDAFSIAGSTTGVWDTPYELKSGYTMSSISNPAFKFVPLDNTVHTFRVFVQVPNQVAVNTDKPVDIIITLGNEEVVYSIR